MELLLQSRLFLQRHHNGPGVPLRDLFSGGAGWMHHYLNALEPAKRKPFPASTNFTRYGVGKYGLCIAASVLGAFLFYRINYLLTPLAVLVFYFFEVQLLFLFPLLIDGVRRPVWRSVRTTQKIGTVKALLTVIPIAFYMVAGLRKKEPHRQWYIGCLAILIWYVKEVRDGEQAVV